MFLVAFKFSDAHAGLLEKPRVYTAPAQRLLKRDACSAQLSSSSLSYPENPSYLF